MLDVVFGIIILFFLMTLIGLGPSLFIRTPNKSCIFYLCIAPALGMVFITLIGTYLVLLNIPIARWALVVTFISIGLSLICCIYKRKVFISSIETESFDSLVYFFLGLIAAALILLIPLAMGGLKNYLMRGNGTDQFNYMAMTSYLMHEPMSLLKTLTSSQLIKLNPTYAWARRLIFGTRWPVSMLMGYFSIVAKVAFVKLIPGICALFLLITYCASYALGLLLKLNKKIVVLVALAITIGFWGQFIFNLQALSQSSSLPLILLLAALLAAIDQLTERLAVSHQILLGLTTAAIIILYVEIVPFVMSGLFVYLILQLITKQYSLNRIKFHLISLAVLVLAVLPMAKFLSHILIQEIFFATQVTNNWWTAYFNWLYSYKLIGFWGLSYLLPQRSGGFFHLLAYYSLVLIRYLFTVVLTYTSCYILFKVIINRSKAYVPVLVLSAAMMVVGLAQFGFLVMTHKYWAAGKVLSYGFPFYFLIAASIWANSFDRASRATYYIGRYCVVGWLVIQLFLGFAYVTNDGWLLNNYITSIAGYKQYDWNLINFSRYFRRHKVKYLIVNHPNGAVRHYVDFVYGRGISITNCADQLCLKRALVTAREQDKSPVYILMNRDQTVNMNTKPVVFNTDLALFKMESKN